MSARRALAGLAALALAGCAARGAEPAAVAIAATAGAERLAACAGDDGWDTPAPPARIFANVYQVGTCGISSILVMGRDGHVLIDSGTERGAAVVLGNLRALGVPPTAVKIILSSHEHVDHVGGIAALQRATGARVHASPAAAAVLASGIAGDDDPQAGLFAPFAAARVEPPLAPGEQVRLGDLALTAHFTPGHTAGATSWSWRSCMGGRCAAVVYADSLNPVSRDGYRFSDHPAGVDAFRRGIATVAALDCDILLTGHPGASDMGPRLAGQQPLVDAGACRAYADRARARLNARLAKEKAER